MLSPRPISLSWSEGRFFDRWMFVHFLGGVTGALSNVFFHLSARGVYTIGLALMIAWEMVEYALGVREAMENRTLDIVFGLLGIAGALRLASVLEPATVRQAFTVSAIAFVSGSFLGWRAHRQRVREATPGGDGVRGS